MMEYVLILFIGCVAGVVTGLIGASGVMVVVPALVILGYATSDAIGASLFIDTIASLVVAWTYYQNKNLNLKQGIWIAIGSVGGAQIGSLISPLIPDVGLSSAFSIFLVITAVIFWFKGAKGGAPDLNNNVATQQSSILKLLRSNVIISGLLLGILVGIISGLLGAGGGVMILLILVFVMQYSMHEGIGTSTLIMAFTAASGTIGHAISSNLPLKAAIYGAIGTLIGGRFAARFANKVNEKVLSKVVGGVFGVLAVIMLIAR
ncbi:MAG: uncharacterized protein PWP48_1676 [Clostridiales bacterium]|jgi:hypothetical protein|nr:uncharacterized protein [Clostridiales bacterium]